jgi:hypothetical protein
MNKLICIVLFAICFNLAERFCHTKTDGFSLQRITGCSEIVTLPTSSDAPTVLKQKFSYFAKGNQCFVFLSEDGKYVLKLFKYAQNTPSWITHIPLINRFKAFRPAQTQHRLWKKERDTLGYKIAFEEWKEETALLAVHLSSTEKIFPTITLFDKLHIAHSLDLNKVDFVLQKRGVVLHEQIKEWMESRQEEKAKEALFAVLEFCAQKIKRGIFDDDGALHNNFGFIDGKLVQLDPGHFKQGDNLDLKKATLRSIRHLKKWLQQSYPTLVPYVENYS